MLGANMMYFQNEYVEAVCLVMLQDGMTEEEITVWCEDMGYSCAIMEDENGN